MGVSPSPASVAVGTTAQLTATATYSDGSAEDVTSTATWAAANSAVATVNASGVVSAVTSGSTAVTAALGALTGSATVNVPAVAPVVKSLGLTPATVSIATGSTQQFTATATYSDGSTANVSPSATWVSSNTSVVTVNAAGLATAVTAGSATVTATISGISATATITVTAVAPTLTAISVTPGAISVTAGATQQFTATAQYSDGSTANVTSTVTWATGSAAVASISATGLASSLSAGTTPVIASLNGVSGTASLTVTAVVVAPTLTAITVTPATASLVVGATQQFTATAVYSDGSSANVTSTAAWTTSSATVATINAAGLASAVASGTTTVTASASGISGTASLSVKAITSISITPGQASFSMGSTQQFTATAIYSDKSTANITSTADWSVANESVATIDTAGLATGVASGSTAVTASFDGLSANVPFVVTIAPGTATNVATWHYDNQRTGLNPNEQSLSLSNVEPQTFGKLFSYLVDGYVYGEPLLISNVTINGHAHNVLYVATENDTVYAFDADTYGTGAPLWQTSLLQAGETPMVNGPIQPYQGVTSTPVIDPSTNTIYVVSAQVAGSNEPTFRLNALDITTGAPRFGGPVTLQASVPGTSSSGVNGVVSLSTACVQRAALLLNNGTLYIGFGGCQTGWLLAYDAKTLAQLAVFNASPNLNGEGPYKSAGGIWMGGGGPVADSSGNIYVTTGNGPWDGQTAWGDSVLKFNANLKLLDYFTPDDYQFMNCQDADLGAGGLMLLPGTNQLLAGGKTGKLYLVNANNLGHEQANDAGATQTLWFEADIDPPYSATCTDSAGAHTATVNGYEIFGTAAWFNGSAYVGVTPTTATTSAGVRQFTYSGTLTPGAYSTPSIQEDTRGTTPFLSANGNNNGILWMIDTGHPLQGSSSAGTNATLRAYDAGNLADEIYNSSINPGDMPGYGIKFTSPIVANGKVYISTGHGQISDPSPLGEIDVYGLK